MLQRERLAVLLRPALVVALEDALNEQQADRGRHRHVDGPPRLEREADRVGWGEPPRHRHRHADHPPDLVQHEALAEDGDSDPLLPLQVRAHMISGCMVMAMKFVSALYNSN